MWYAGIFSAVTLILCDQVEHQLGLTLMTNKSGVVRDYFNPSPHYSSNNCTWHCHAAWETMWVQFFFGFWIFLKKKLFRNPEKNPDSGQKNIFLKNNFFFSKNSKHKNLDFGFFWKMCSGIRKKIPDSGQKKRFFFKIKIQNLLCKVDTLRIEVVFQSLCSNRN
jgi:hypothetical protein